MSTLLEHVDDDDDLPVKSATARAPSTAPTRSGVTRRLRWIVIATMAIAALLLALRGRGVGAWVKQTLGMGGVSLAPPLVVGASPSDGAINVKPTDALTVRVHLPNGALNAATLTGANVTLRKDGVETPIETALSHEVDSKGTAIITLRPARPLDGMSKYAISVGAGLKDAKGVGAVAKVVRFSTGSLADPSIKFTQVSLPNAMNTGFTCVQMGPDGRLWATSDEGKIFRFPIEAGGLLGKPEIFISLQDASGGNRLLIGLTFDPSTGQCEAAPDCPPGRRP